MKNLFQFIFFLLLPLGVFSQQAKLIGTVKDEKTKEHLYFVNILLSKDSISLHTSTDFKEYFLFDSLLPSSYHLKIIKTGYHTFDTLIKIKPDTNKLNIELLADTSMLSEGIILQSNYNKKGALKDIQNGDITLLLPGGIVGAGERPNDKSFMKKYDLVFISQGCIRLPGENEEAYNKEMFKYLDKKYGRVWRRHVRNDVIGL